MDNEKEHQLNTPKHIKIKDLDTKKSIELNTSSQLSLDLGIEVQRNIGGVEMGVLENGIPFLTQRGLAKICNINNGVVSVISTEWEKAIDTGIFPKGRITFLKDYLFDRGYTENKLYIETKKNNIINYAYTDIVCMAILELYAFETTKEDKTIPLKHFRNISRYGLQEFIYKALDYNISDQWKFYHDRVSLLKNTAPEGYFIIFHEVTGMIVDLITSGLAVNDKTIPDGSVGSCWGRYWTGNNLSKKYGDRIEYEHNYPEYYPQSASNPQPAKAYPDVALPEFRQWFRREYLPLKFPNYILKKANILSGGKTEATLIANMYKENKLSNFDKSLKKAIEFKEPE